MKIDVYITGYCDVIMGIQNAQLNIVFNNKLSIR